MDVLAHALWAGAGMLLARRRWAITPRTAAATVALAVAPDIPHLLPILGWSVFGAGNAATVKGYAIAVPGQEPAVPPGVDWLSHNLHCVTHSAIVAAVATLLLWIWLRSLWVPLLGWWSHVVIDVFTHSVDYYPSPTTWTSMLRPSSAVSTVCPWPSRVKVTSSTRSSSSSTTRTRAMLPPTRNRPEARR